jgi:UDP-glucose 4-epimerase
MNADSLPRSVALIGAGGFFGTNLARYLSPQIEDLRCFGPNQSFPDAMQAIRWTSGDMASSSLIGVISGCDTVIHLASTSVPGTDSEISKDAEDNLMTSLRLFDRCVDRGVRQVIFISSGGTVYGPNSRVPIAESAPTQPITPYGVVKLTIEKYLEVYARLRGLDYRIVRISNLYGPYQNSIKMQGVVTSFLAKALRNEALEIWGNGSIVRDYVYVEDAAEAMAAVMCYQGEKRIFNIGSGVGTSVNQIVASIEKLLERKLKVKYRLGRAVDVPVNILDCTLARNELGWHARTSFSSGLEKTRNWLNMQKVI